ncbi:hypothetical protein YC2023_039903 [Brassica napus]
MLLFPCILLFELITGQGALEVLIQWKNVDSLVRPRVKVYVLACPCVLGRRWFACCRKLSITEAIIRPGLEPGAVDVFLEFICYYGGPLPEDLLPQFKCPVLVAWGEKDPWDPINLGRAYGNFDAAPQVSPLSNEDEKPEMVNPLIESVVARHSKSSTALAPGI